MYLGCGEFPLSCFLVWLWRRLQARERDFSLLAKAKKTVKDLFRGKRNLISTPNIENMELIAFQSGLDTYTQFAVCSGAPPSFSRQSGTVIIMVTMLFSSWICYSLTNFFLYPYYFICCFRLLALVFSTEGNKKQNPNKTCNFISSVSRELVICSHYYSLHMILNFRYIFFLLFYLSHGYCFFPLHMKYKLWSRVCYVICCLHDMHYEGTVPSLYSPVILLFIFFPYFFLKALKDMYKLIRLLSWGVHEPVLLSIHNSNCMHVYLPLYSLNMCMNRSICFPRPA